MEVDYRLLVGRIAEALRRFAQSDARHLAESSHTTTARTDERWSREPRAERRGSGASGLFVVGLRPLGVAARRRCPSLGTRASLTFLAFRVVPSGAPTTALS